MLLYLHPFQHGLEEDHVTLALAGGSQVDKHRHQVGKADGWAAGGGQQTGGGRRQQRQNGQRHLGADARRFLDLEFEW